MDARQTLAVVFGAMTEGYECGYEEVRCKPWKEWLSDNGRFGFVVVPIVSFVVTSFASGESQLRR